MRYRLGGGTGKIRASRWITVLSICRRRRHVSARNYLTSHFKRYHQEEWKTLDPFLLADGFINNLGYSATLRMLCAAFSRGIMYPPCPVVPVSAPLSVQLSVPCKHGLARKASPLHTCSAGGLQFSSFIKRLTLL